VLICSGKVFLELGDKFASVCRTAEHQSCGFPESDFICFPHVIFNSVVRDLFSDFNSVSVCSGFKETFSVSFLISHILLLLIDFRNLRELENGKERKSWMCIYRNRFFRND